MKKKKRSVINERFETWINNFPESYHWKDTERFYSLVWTVCRYDRNPKDRKREKGWLRDKIDKRDHNLTGEDIKYYCDLFQTLQDFYKYVK